MQRARWRVGAALAAMTIAGSLTLGSVPGMAAKAKVKARSNDTWKSKHTYIGKGDRVIWKNPDSEQHDVTFYVGSRFSASLPPGGTVKKRFKKKKTYLYRCAVHSGIVNGECQGMCGFVHVV